MPSDDGQRDQKSDVVLQSRPWLFGGNKYDKNFEIIKVVKNSKGEDLYRVYKVSDLTHDIFGDGEKFLISKVDFDGDIQLDGSQHFTLENEQNFDFEHTDPFSISFRIKPDKFRGDAVDVISKSMGQTGWLVRYDTNDQKIIREIKRSL